MEPKSRQKSLKPMAKIIDARNALFDAMEVHQGALPPLEGVPLIADGNLTLTRRGLDFVTPGGALISYRLGGSIAVTKPGDQARDDTSLFLWGTVFGAVAWLHDLVPIHASSVAAGGRAIAFTADSGGGKSTLAAALSHRDFRHICDDTLVLVPEGRRFWALPDGKPLKLWDDAATRMGCKNLTPIPTIAGKSYVEVFDAAEQPFPLTDLILLEPGDAIRLEPIEGGAKLELLAQALYRGFIHAARVGVDEHAEMMLNIGQNLRFWRLVRPMEVTQFDPEADAVAGLLRQQLEIL